MATLAIIGGTGLTQLTGLTITNVNDVETPFGTPSSAVIEGRLKGKKVLFIARHGHPHKIPPHQVNYRANIWALKEAGATDVVAINAVGGITVGAGEMVIPDQVIDYTYGREHTFFEGDLNQVTHVDLSYPYTEQLRELLKKAATSVSLQLIDGGVYGATQGPRLETIAEIRRLKRDGCDVVGMTGMPETALAREQKLNYACISLVVNPAAGISPNVITIKQIEMEVAKGMGKVRSILEKLVEQY